ncbi:MAG: hypothetical protein U5L09_02835 [Bacteroidales bacterium]|nr:hypothetical protein [Bacteroidales bacterium]
MKNNNSHNIQGKLEERIKELNCLYGLSELINTPELSREELLQSAVELIPRMAIS